VGMQMEDSVSCEESPGEQRQGGWGGGRRELERQSESPWVQVRSKVSILTHDRCPSLKRTTWPNTPKQLKVDCSAHEMLCATNSAVETHNTFCTTGQREESEALAISLNRVRQVCICALYAFPLVDIAHFKL
jgi:hypothetical protein